MEAARWLPPTSVISELKVAHRAATQVETRLGEVTYVAGHFRPDLPSHASDSTLLRDCNPPRIRGKYSRRRRSSLAASTVPPLIVPAASSSVDTLPAEVAPPNLSGLSGSGLLGRFDPGS